MEKQFKTKNICDNQQFINNRQKNTNFKRQFCPIEMSINTK